MLLVGGPRTGKQTLTETAAKLLELSPHHLNPSVAGTFRELYGDHDPFSIHRVGPLTTPLLSTVLGMPPSTLLVLEGDSFGDPLYESLLPYLEARSFYQQE